jgi:hypothetical protein
MFMITEADAAAIRAVYEQEGELSAAIELRRLFPASSTRTEEGGDHELTIKIIGGLPE